MALVGNHTVGTVPLVGFPNIGRRVPKRRPAVRTRLASLVRLGRYATTEASHLVVLAAPDGTASEVPQIRGARPSPTAPNAGTDHSFYHLGLPGL